MYRRVYIWKMKAIRNQLFYKFYSNNIILTLPCFNYSLIISQIFLLQCFRNWFSEAKRLSSPKEFEAFYLDTIDKEISILEKELSGPHQRIGFCHNDLQYGNIMLDEETNSVTIIVSFSLCLCGS